jgi:uncharacterized YigZ family protein
MVQEYYTVKNTSISSFQNSGSKFIAIVSNCNSEDEFKNQLHQAKKKFPKATHYCYAFSFIYPHVAKKCNDDGEPSGTAGLPILNKIQSSSLENISAIVVRYYGGKKLGTSGLINAYKTATSQAIADADKTLITVYTHLSIEVNYTIENLLRKLIAQHHGIILEQHFQENIKFIIKIPLKNKDIFKQIILQNPLIEQYEI